ncbi:AsmA-like C-terminal region-containing protein [Marinobacter sp. TBZ242]|uniref:AsmA-like C-terminal region-containing protein n=1 Tax=Marinobacter azerbaijanicus TaxID=3050455 RepID=A0ABT7IG20_9GAMM|nr:AsmA-like C-terminal region-containing protein [Marinobacter sp. TBZ242]MDL0432059.1 AsmA-like C-terminal region-containing protein [Marinobacter sp. TBZ242]
MAEQEPRHILVRSVSGIASLIWWLLLVVIVLLALYAGLGRQLTQNINDYRPNIEQLLSSRLGQDVRIGSLSSSWNWLNPTIVARDIFVLSDGEGDDVAGSLQSVRIGLDFLASLGRLRIVFTNFEADGLELTVNQTRRGEVMVEGMDIPEPVANDIELWLDLAGTWLSDPSVKITRLDLGVRDNNDQLRHVEIPQLDLVYQRGLFHASGRAMRPGTTEQLASFGLVGRHFFRGDFTGQIYADINSGRLFDGLIEEYAWRDIRVEGFDLGGQLWMTFRDGFMDQISGTLATPYLQIGAGGESLAPLEDISARFGWRRRQDVPRSEPPDRPWYSTGEFHLKGLEWQWRGDRVTPFSVRFRHQDNGPQIIADGLPLRPLRRLVTSLGLLPEMATRALENYRPTGTLNQLMLNLPREGNRRFELAALMKQMSIRAYGGAPAVSGLDGKLVMDNDGGYVDARSDELTLGFPKLYSGFWDLEGVRAGVAWRLEGDITRVYSDDIRMVHGSGAGLTGAFDLRMDRHGEDSLGLRVGVRDGTADMLAEFVPVKAVSPGLYEWLTTAITEVNVTKGEYFGHGLINRDAPPGSFVSSMVYHFQDATVRYDELWPEVTDASGTVYVQNGRTRVDVDSGRTGGLELEPGQVRVEPGDDVRVFVDAAAPVPGDVVAYWMDSSPLGDMAGEAGKSIRLDGNYHLDLGLELPLSSESPPAVRATVRADAGTLTYPPANLQWTQISGELNYSTSEGFSDEPLRARFMGAPVTVLLREAETGGMLGIRQYGRLDVGTLLAETALPEGTRLGLSGEFGYQATLEVSPDTASAVKLYSDLSGLAVSWPEPLAKEAGEEAPLSATIAPGDKGGVSVSVDWPDRLGLDLSWQADSLDIAVNSLFLGERQLTDIDISARQDNGQWVIDAESEWLAGSVFWPGDDSPVTVDLERLKLARSDDAPDDETPPLPEPEEQLRAFRELSMENWPDIDLHIAGLQLGEDDAGAWSLGLRPEATRLRIQDIAGNLKSLTLGGELVWSIAGGRETTRFTGDITGQSLADLGNLFGTEIPFRSESTAVNMDIDWQGGPNEFDLSRLSGSVSARFDDGVILEGNNTAQLFRIFNLLNSDTLWRRLQLDFSDLYEAGVAFDAISGKASMINGLLTLDPELQVVGPSGAFKLTGTTDMIEETLDMKMVVVLPLTQNLPLAALLMGAGAPIGGALFVLDKVLGDPLSKLTSATYSVSGSWDEPDVRLRRVFDTGQ